MFFIPLLLILAVFSFYPIITSFVYTAFDYNILSRRQSQLFLSEAFDAEIFYQQGDFIAFFLEDEIVLADGDAVGALTAIQSEMKEIITSFDVKDGIISLGLDEIERLIPERPSIL
jgi:multiple sugar transport system permease protein